MKTLGTLLQIPNMRYPKVTYYTVWKPYEKYHEFDDFRVRFSEHAGIATRRNYSAIISLIDVMGVKHGCRRAYFKHEGAADRLVAQAFPTTQKFDEMLRLYCIRLGSDVCVLLNGDIKSMFARTAQECPNVEPHFTFANEVAQFIDNHILQKEIQFHRSPLPEQFEITN